MPKKLLLTLIISTSVANAQNSSQLDEVEVLGDVAPVRQIKDWQEYERSTGTDIKDILADQVAVQFGGGNGLSQHITIRGMGADQIDFVVDDTSTDATNIFHHQGRFMLDPALVKIIGIEKGAGSASSGIGATSGKVEATTVDAEDLLLDGKNVGARIKGGISSNKGYQEGLAVYGQSADKQFDGIVVGNWVQEKDYKSGTKAAPAGVEVGKIGNSALGNRSYLVKGNYRPSENLKITASHRHENQYGERNLREEFFFNTDNDSPTYRNRSTDTTNLALSAQNMGFISNFDGNVFYIKSKHESSANNTPKVGTAGSNLRFTSDIGKHKVKYGINWRNEEAQNQPQPLIQEKTDTGLYAEGIWNFEPITLTTGLRYDHFKIKSKDNPSPVEANSASDGNLNPSFGVIYDINDNLSLKASHNYATRSPRIYEVYLANNSVSFDKDLKAERSQNSELGIQYSIGGLNLEATGFYQKIKDLQNYDGGGRTGKPIRMYTAGNLRNTGYELNASYRNEGFTGRIGVAKSNPKIDGSTADVIQTAIPMGTQITTALSYQFKDPRLEVGWRGRYATKSEYLTAATNRGGGEIVKRSGYGVHDLYANWQPLKKDNFNVNLSVDNIFNRYYRSHSQRAGATALPEPGRDIRLNFSYRF